MQLNEFVSTHFLIWECFFTRTKTVAEDDGVSLVDRIPGPLVSICVSSRRLSISDGINGCVL